MNASDVVLQEKEGNTKTILAVSGTFVNYLGFIILLFDKFHSWETRPFAMTTGMVITKIVIIACMMLGTVLCLLAQDKITYVNMRKTLMVNVIAYAGIAALVVYLTDVPNLWQYVAYVAVTLVCEAILFKKK